MRDNYHRGQGLELLYSQAIRPWLIASLVALLCALASAPAQAGCGCQKPPPKPAQVHPQV